MNILLTGATGFIGNKVLETLSKKKIKIYATYTTQKPRFLINKNIKWIKFDIYKLNSLKIKLQYVDLVIHLSWPYLPNYNTKKHLNPNLNAQKKFIKKLINSGVKNFFIAGTCYEYGKKNGRLLEGTKKNPNNPYALSKDLLRKYLHRLNKKKLINIVWGRIFYIYGFNSRRDTLYNLVTKSKRIKNISVASNFYRDYLNIDVLAKIIVILSLQKKNFGEVNLCSGFSISLKKLTNYFCKVNKISNNINYEKKINKLEADNFCGNNKKLIKILKNSLSKNKFNQLKLLMIKHKK